MGIQLYHRNDLTFPYHFSHQGLLPSIAQTLPSDAFSVCLGTLTSNMWLTPILLLTISLGVVAQHPKRPRVPGVAFELKPDYG
jgi:hypothetical protein